MIQREVPNKVNAAVEMVRAREGSDASEAGTHAEIKGESEALLNVKEVIGGWRETSASSKSTTIGRGGQK